MRWRVPLADIDLGKREVEAVTRVLQSRWLTMGEVTQDFERRFAEYLGVKYAFAVTNGTVALHMANATLGIGPGAEVIVPSLTFVATANAVLYTGAQPVFADIASLDDLTIAPRDIERRITKHTRAITVMHYGGYLCAMDEILRIAHQYDLAVIEDAAHAPGASLSGRMAGTLGDIGCFSFFSNKNLATGEGGMLVTNRDDLAEKLRIIRSHGMTSLTWDRHRGHAYSYDVVELGYNYRIDEMHSALGIVQLDKLEHNNQRRRELTAEYQRLLSDVPGVQVPFREHPGTSSCHILPILLDSQIDRRAFMAGMRDCGIQTSIHYPPIHQFSYYRDRYADQTGRLPVTESVGLQEVTLPLYPAMGLGDVQTVVAAIRQTSDALLADPAADCPSAPEPSTDIAIAQSGGESS